MLTLSFGYKKPQSGDRGSIWFPALEFDIQRLNDHNHDGINSAKLSPGATTSVSQVLPVAWTLVDTAKWKQSVTISSSLQYDEVLIQPRKTSDKSLLHLTVTKTGANTYDIYTGDPTLDVTVVYGS